MVAKLFCMKVQDGTDRAFRCDLREVCGVGFRESFLCKGLCVQLAAKLFCLETFMA